MSEVYTKRVNCNVPLCWAIAEYEYKEVFFCAYHYNMIHVKGAIEK